MCIFIISIKVINRNYSVVEYIFGKNIIQAVFSHTYIVYSSPNYRYIKKSASYASTSARYGFGFRYSLRTYKNYFII